MKRKKLMLTSLLLLVVPEITHAAQYVVCGNDNKMPLLLAQLISTLMTIVKIFIPILLVISGMISFFKVTFSSNVEDEMKKAKNKLINNIIAAIIIFFVISIINFAVSLVVGANNNVMSCVYCLINPDKCEQIDPNGNKLCPGFIDQEYDENCNPINNNTESNEEKKSNEDNLTMEENANTQSNTQPEEIKPTYIDNILVVNKTYALPSDYAPASAKGIEEECIDEKCFTSQTWEAYQSMARDAKYKAIYLRIGSGYRSYNYQSYIYNNYVELEGQQKADTYSARPGHSEHQTGLAFDVCDRNVSACVTSAFDSTNQAKWISDNCYKYGLILRYPKGKTNETGYMYESWHLRYVGVELATKLYNNGSWITLEDYYGIDSKYS